MAKKIQCEVVGGNSSPLSKAIRNDMLVELMEVSKAPIETIVARTIRKRNMDGLIKILTNEKEAKDE